MSVRGQSERGRPRGRLMWLVLGALALAAVLALPTFAGAQSLPGGGDEAPKVDDPKVPDVDDPKLPDVDDPTGLTDGLPIPGEDGRVDTLATEEDTSTLDGDGFFGPLFKEPDNFIDGPLGPGRPLNTQPDGDTTAPSPNEAFIAQSPSECVVLEGENRTLAQKNADPENDGFINCRVPSGSIAMTPFGEKLVSFNAVDSTENNEASIVFEYGVKSISDRTRAFEISKGAEKGTDFKIPDPEDGGANPEPGGNPDEQPVVDPLKDENGQNDGGLFCADLTFLPDGRVMAVGGTNYYNDPGIEDRSETSEREDGVGAIELQGIKNSRVYDSRTNRWTQIDRMNRGRWYPTLVTLGNGDTFVASGVTKLIKPQYVFPPRRKDGAKPDESGRNVTAVETLSDPESKWKEAGDPEKTDLEGDLADRSLPLFPRLHLLPNGHVFYNTSGQSFNPAGQSFDQTPSWNQAASYDPDEEKWTSRGIPGTMDARPGEVVRDPGFRGSTSSTMLTLKPDENGEYKKVELLVGGGIPSQGSESPGRYFPRNTSRITEVEVDGDDVETTTHNTGSMKNRSQQPDPVSGQPGDPDAAPDTVAGNGRWYPSTQVLPTGQVIAFAGADRDEVAFPGVEKAIKDIEIFEPNADNPDTTSPDKDKDGAWRTAASSERRRTYHNTSALLPDGRILLGGHATISTGYTRNTEIADRGPNGHDPTSEIWTPPNRTKEALAENPMPKIESAPGCADNGDTIGVDTDISKEDVQSVVLVRNVSQTHVVDADQRIVELKLEETDGDELKAKIPDGEVVPEGPYMLFVNKKGTPVMDENGKPKLDDDGNPVRSSTVHSESEQMFIGPDACDVDRNGNDDDSKNKNDNKDKDDDDRGEAEDGIGVLGGVSTGATNACLPKGMRISGRGIGTLGLGLTRAATVLTSGIPATVAKRAFRYCVNGGGRTYVSYSGKGRAQMVVSVQAQKGPKGLTRGNSTDEVRRAYRNARTLGRNHKNLIAPLRGGGAIVFGVDKGRVRYVGVIDKRLAGNLSLLRYYLRGVRLQ